MVKRKKNQVGFVAIISLLLNYLLIFNYMALKESIGHFGDIIMQKFKVFHPFEL